MARPEKNTWSSTDIGAFDIIFRYDKFAKNACSVIDIRTAIVLLYIIFKMAKPEKNVQALTYI